MLFTGHASVHGTLKNCSIAIGSFDGVHIGHQTLLLAAAAVPHTGPVVALTFAPHPAKVLKPEFAPKLIMSLTNRVEFLHQAGADNVLVEPFNAELAALDAETFVDRILIKSLQASAVTVGHDFTYGTDRLGNTHSLNAQLQAAGIECRILAPISIDGMIASSTRVRAFVLDGQMQGARIILGRHFSLCGTVVHGAGRGGGLGFKTLNINSDNELFPRRGVYATWTMLPGFDEALPSVSNVGRNPTFGEEDLHIETHVLANIGEQYDANVELRFVERLREEKRFSDAKDLVAQIRKDVDQTHAVLAKDQQNNQKSLSCTDKTRLKQTVVN